MESFTDAPAKVDRTVRARPPARSAATSAL